MTKAGEGMRPQQKGGIRFVATQLTPVELELQAEVRAFVAAELGDRDRRPGLGMNGRADRAFSAKLGARGWLGMALPKRYGGSERTVVDRFVVTEELLRCGAPIGHHWVADRQSGPVINRFGTEEQKQRYLPGICTGTYGFSIGMSEPDVGSDLAAVRTRAERNGDGWVINGTKVWTTGAHRNDFMITLCRTSDEDDRHGGLTQFIVDLGLPGVEIRPIPLLDGSADFNEVVLTDVRVGADAVLGDVGQGWSQNTAELAFERGGPDRFMSTYPVLEAFLRESDRAAFGEREHVTAGRLVADYWVLRNLALALARAVDRGESPISEAALLKERATRFEQEVVVALLDIIDIQPRTDSSSMFEQLLCEAVLTGPAVTIRGGTNEILRSVAAKGLSW
jgi:alkylation response protein AidB-like acyl-CoA dehydrogenase